MHPSDHYIMQIPDPTTYRYDECVVYEVRDLEASEAGEKPYLDNDTNQLVLPYTLDLISHRLRKRYTRHQYLAWKPQRVYWQSNTYPPEDRTTTPDRIEDPTFKAMVEIAAAALQVIEAPTSLADTALPQTEVYGVPIYVKCVAQAKYHTIVGWTELARTNLTHS